MKPPSFSNLFLRQKTVFTLTRGGVPFMLGWFVNENGVSLKDCTPAGNDAAIDMVYIEPPTSYQFALR
jgi:hypothetical protein